MTSNGGVIRTTAAEIKQSGRQTMGVRLMNLADGDSVVAIARNVESIVESELLEDSGSDDGEGGDGE
jgi:DNA gyrase subunit A